MQTNSLCDALVLSELSLFVYDDGLMIKTCGTTSLLHILPRVLEIIYAQGAVVTHVRFTPLAASLPYSLSRIGALIAKSSTCSASFLRARLAFSDATAVLIPSTMCSWPATPIRLCRRSADLYWSGL